MSTEFSASRPSPPPPGPSRKPATLTKAEKQKQENDKKRALLIRGSLALLLLLLIGTAYAFLKPDLAAQAKAQIAAIDNNPELTTAEKWQKKRDLREELAPEARKAVDNERFQEFRKRENERLKTFFAKSPQEQRKELRDMIEKGEKRRKEWEARNGGGGGGGGAGGGGGRGGAGGAVGGAPAGAGGAAGPSAAASNANGSGRGKMSPEARQIRRDEMKDIFTPEERAQRTAYRIMTNQVRESMGLPPRTGFGGRGGGGPGGFGGFGPPGGGPSR